MSVLWQEFSDRGLETSLWLKQRGVGGLGEGRLEGVGRVGADCQASWIGSGVRWGKTSCVREE